MTTQCVKRLKTGVKRFYSASELIVLQRNGNQIQVITTILSPQIAPENTFEEREEPQGSYRVPPADDKFSKQ